MNVWKATWYDPDPERGQRLRWCRTQKEALQCLKEELARLQQEHGPTEDGTPTSVSQVEFPATKTELLEWLNTHFDSDND